MRFRRWALAGLVLLTQLAGCQPQQTPASPLMSAAQSNQPASNQPAKYSLSAGPCVPEGYPARLQEARFITPNGGSFPVPYGHFLESTWGRSGIGWAVGEEYQQVPDSLELLWFSYTEDKFYEGHFLLPYERLQTLLAQGYWDAENKKQDTYGGFTVCVLPTGVVVVWLDGTNKVLVGRYQARKVAFDFQRFNPAADRTEVIKERQAALSPKVRREIATGTLSTEQWDAYLKTYPWQLAFSRPLTLTDFGIGYVNAENTSVPHTPDMAAYAQLLLTPSPKPVPTYAMLYVAGAYGRKRLLKVEGFDEAETMAAFQTLAAQHPQEVITLFVDVDKRLSKAALSLRAGGQVLPLAESPVQFFDLE